MEPPQWFTDFVKDFDMRMDAIEKKLDEMRDIKQSEIDNKQAIEQIKSQNEALAKQTKLMKQCITQSQSRRENLLSDGFPETNPNETWADSEQRLYGMFQNHLKLNNPQAIKFERVHHVGHYTPGKTRSITAKFSYFKDREAVWNSRTNLTGSKYFSSEDYPLEILQARKILYPILRAALKLAENPLSGIKKVSPSLDKLILNGKVYTIADLSKLM